MEANRLIDRLQHYWRSLARDGGLPDYNRFNSEHISDLWPKCIVFTVLPSFGSTTPSLCFLRIGEDLRSFYPSSMLDQPFKPEARQFQAAAVVRKFGDLVTSQGPIIDVGQFISDRHKVVKYRSCLLPFGRKGVITHALAGLSWKEF